MVERCFCKAEVSGSSPLTSTKIGQARRPTRKTSATHMRDWTSEPAGGKIQHENLENCIATNQVEKSITDIKKIKLKRADGGYLGTQRRRRTWLPTKRFGELEAC